MRFYLVLIAVAAGLVLTSPAHAASRDCGLTSRIDGVKYQVRETKGTVSCRTVKRVVTRFLRDGEAKRPWSCSRGHGDSPYAASCSRGEKVLVRVYAPG
jgi:hypothetical protein